MWTIPWVSVSVHSKGSSISNVFFILLNQEGCTNLIPQGWKLAICNHGGKSLLLHFPVWMIGLKGGSLCFEVEGCLRINVPKINMDPCRYTDRFSLVCANSISGGMPMEVVTLVEWRRREMWGRSGYGQEQGIVNWWWAEGWGRYLFPHFQIEFLTNSEHLISCLPVPFNTCARNMAATPIIKFTAES